MARALFPLAVAGCLMALMPPASRLAFDPIMKEVAGRPTAEPIASLIATYAEQYALDPALLQAVIKVESNFNSDAVSSKGAIGLMQLMPLTAAAFHVLDPFDPKDNIRAGAALLRGLLDRFGGDLSLALAAYHLGEARVRQAIGVPALPATQLYVNRVLGHYDRFRAGTSRLPTRVTTRREERRTLWSLQQAPE
ncbi:MAG TPA: lytic transglycosylase domain-containing protein [Nitrospira sp.]|nr:lytic transglycosylase domain-containing protein [Nitrospira sp.]MCW5794226.1 lytic transglycosylase domain-containing protein [Nitrospira sp.]HMU29183.1 lytic transglycosylase domain-containing protein [Nitrospira sp.]HMV56535.1 lytic transglycosylase domain-containing protein [Nitrospira sp.]HMX90972.1 lytic transglycosylase domain-containing protein [Nitrospira sp.]